MPVFSLEALDAQSGDALLVHYGSPADPHVVVVDGGFASTYNDRLKPRLAALRAAFGLSDTGPVPVDHVIVSHLDNDHISGIVRMFRELREAQNRGDALPYDIGRLWHNSFDDSLREIARTATVPAAVSDVAADSDVLAASIAGARELRDIAELFNLDGNPPFDGLVLAPREVDLGDGLEVTVVGPNADRLRQLQREWEDDVVERLEEGDTARVAAYVDESVPNLSSIVVHVRFGGLTMLLTGDGRGDDTLRGLAAAGLLGADGTCRVDVLKVPHHGSDRDVESDYFDTVVADHYVISGDGRHDNPSAAMFEMLTASQGDRPYTIHLTYPAGSEVLDADRATNTRNYQVKIRDEGELSLRVDLGDPAP